jgi:hypothetical protein
MDQKQAYELTIAEKLGALPIPDLKDAIWSRIEDQLDIDLPTDEGGGSSGPQSPDWRSILARTGPFAVIVAIITLIIVNKQKRKNQDPVQTRPFPSAQTTQPQKSGANPQNKSGPVIFPGTAKQTSRPGVNQPGDSVLNRQPVIADNPFPLDSTVLQTSLPPQINPPLVVAPSPKDTIQKKPKGVKGLTDGDYRIVPKKDSTR